MHTVIFPDSEKGRREWIKATLRAKGHSLSSISRAMGLSRMAAQRALWSKYPRMERAIAEALGTSPDTIWPERYVNGTQRRSRRGRPECMHADNASTGAGPKQEGR